MSDLITRSDDERLEQLKPYGTYGIMRDHTRAADAARLLGDSLRAALAAKEKAEGALCRAREGWEITEEDVRRVQASDKDSIICALRGALAFTETTIANYLAEGSPKDEPELLQARDISNAALSSSAPCPHAEEAKRLREALEKIANYDWVKGGRIIFGNADLPGDAGQFYRGYNAGIKGQFEATKAIAEVDLRRSGVK